MTVPPFQKTALVQFWIQNANTKNEFHVCSKIRTRPSNHLNNTKVLKTAIQLYKLYVDFLLAFWTGTNYTWNIYDATWGLFIQDNIKIQEPDKYRFNFGSNIFQKIMWHPNLCQSQAKFEGDKR